MALVITIDSKENAMPTDSDAVLLRVPNKLLFGWYQSNTAAAKYVSLVNDAILDRVIQLKPESEELARKLCQRACSVFAAVSKKAGRARLGYLKRSSVISFSSELVIKVSELQEKVEELNQDLCELQHDFTLAIEELATSQESIEHMTSKLNEVILERSEKTNAGKAYEYLGSRQKRRKLSQFQRAADAALWFGESFGLIPAQLTVRSSVNDESLTIPLNSTSPPHPDTPLAREVDEFCAMQTLYLLDRFGVSDEFYHELTQVYPSLQRSYTVKDVRKRLNAEVDIIRVENGAYRPFKKTLSAFLTHIESSSDEICVKVSGDGARFSSSSSFLLLSFSFPGSSENVLSGAGNHTFAAIRGTESYSLLSSLTDVMSDINSLIEDPVLDGKQLCVVFGGDYKFLLLSMGMNAAHSTYACLWCSVTSDKRWDMSVNKKVYTDTSKKARTLQKMKELSGHSYSSCARHLGCVFPPLVNISLDHIVMDELHLLLRIMDVLIRNLILYADSEDHRQKEHHGTERHNVRKLEQTIRSCGVCFQIWQNKEPTGKPIPGSYDWTPLSGKHKLLVLKKLPAKMDTLLKDDLSAHVAKLWNDFLSLYTTLSSSSPTSTQVSSFHEDAKQWVRDFLSLKMQGHQRKFVTPYMHCMVYHVPTTLEKYGNLKQFSGQGVEKNNDDSKRHYFSSNKHDAPGEIIRSECRQEKLRQGVWDHPTCVRKRRSYTKSDEDYWTGGGIQEVRKRSREDTASPS